MFTSLGLSATSIKKLGANNVSALKTLEKTSEVVKSHLKNKHAMYYFRQTHVTVG